MLSRLIRCCGFVALGLQAQTAPAYLEVVQHVWSNYSFEPEHYIQTLARTPKGWDIAYEYNITNDGQAEPIRWHPLWRGGRYKELKLRMTNPVQQVPDHMRRNLYSYERCIYYGYPQWSKDVIKHYGRKKNLSLPELEALARAYSHYARAYVNGAQWGDMADGDKEGRQGADSFGRITAFQAEQFSAMEEKALDAMDRMVALDPNYPVLVGHIRNKQANECMDAWMILKVHGHPSLAEKFLRRAQYDPIMRHWAQTLLSQVDDYGILVTNGDNDTYPLWYEQAMAAPDSRLHTLSVVNNSLLSMPVFTAAACYRPPVGARLNMQFAAIELERNGGKISLPSWTSIKPGDTVSARDFLSELYAGEAEVQAGFVYAVKGKDSFCLNTRERHFLSPSQWHALDIWLSAAQRPVYASYLMKEELNLYSGIVKRGLVYQLGDQTATQRIDTAGFTAWLLREYKPVPPDPDWHERMHATADLFAGQLAATMAEAIHAVRPNTPEAELLGQKALELYPAGGFYGNDGAVKLMEALYRKGMVGTAGHLLSLWVSDVEERMELFRFGKMGGVLAQAWLNENELRNLETRWANEGMPVEAMRDLRNALSQSRGFR
ncbi:MAG: hypothetical protein ACOVSS_09340 [Bacteroidia bacterium]